MDENNRVMFGDGNFGIFKANKMAKKNKDGKLMMPICFIPFDKLKREGEIEQSELDLTEDPKYGKKPKGSVWRAYPKSKVDQIRYNFWFVWCDVNGGDTIYTMKEGILFEYIELMEKKEDDLREVWIELSEENKMLQSQLTRYLEKIKEYQEIFKGGSEKGKEEEGGTNGEEN